MLGAAWDDTYEEGPELAVPIREGGDVRLKTELLLAHGAEAVARALSRDSAEFLRANRQKGGQ